MNLLADQIAMVDQASLIELSGTVLEVRGLALRVADLPVPIGAMVRIFSRRGGGVTIDGEVVGFDHDQTIVMPFGVTAGIGRGDRVIAQQFFQTAPVAQSLRGRVLDGLGRPIDGGGPLRETINRPLNPPPIDPLDRMPIDMPLATGIRAIDAIISIGRGQRLGVFASPGVGKSVLLGMMARHTDADVTVIALVGERGREVKDFIENNIGPEGMAKCVVVCATSDQPPLLRLRAALVATTVAEYFRDQGDNVLLIMDSVTRFCQAQRQVGLAAGEPPATKGFPPSTFSMLPALLERSGRTTRGSITGFYAVLVEGDELTDPVSEAARGVLDGHVQLSRDLANKGHWPAIDILGSISRLADQLTDSQHQEARQQVLRLTSAYQQVEELLNIGAYAAGGNPDFDLAITCKPLLDQFLQQGRTERPIGDAFETARKQLLATNQQIQAAKKQLDSQMRRSAAIPQPAGG